MGRCSEQYCDLGVCVFRRPEALTKTQGKPNRAHAVSVCVIGVCGYQRSRVRSYMWILSQLY